MRWSRHIVCALPAAAVWLLVASMCAGSVAGIGGAVAPAAANLCGISCPCERAEDAGDQAALGDDVQDRAAGDDHPREETCPDGCTDCSCCRGVAMALFAPLRTPIVLCASRARLLFSFEVPAGASGGGVFRPPRSLG